MGWRTNCACEDLRTPVETPHDEGDALDVIGVDQGDVLNVREGPDPGAPVVAELDPLAMQITTTGEARQVPDSGIWLQVRAGAELGWSNTAYLAYLGQTRDRTAEVADLGEQESMDDLAAAVTDQLARGEDGSVPLVTITHEGTDGDLSTMVLDVPMDGDDSVGGERLELFADTDDGRYLLVRVESTQICLRGVAEEGCL